MCMMVESGHQPDMLRQQHAIAKDVTGHITDTHHGEIRTLDIHAHFPEMALHRHPGATCGNAHFLVVVAGTAT